MIGLGSTLPQPNKVLIASFFFFLSSFIFSEAIVNAEDIEEDGEKGFLQMSPVQLIFPEATETGTDFSLQSSLDYSPKKI